MINPNRFGAGRRGLRFARAVGAVAVALGALLSAGALAQTTGPLTQISGASPFGPLANCGSVAFGGTNFLDSEVEPWIEVNPSDPANIVAVWQQDRWSNGGARSNLAGVSFDGGATWQSIIIAGLTDCSGGPFDRASDPWVSISPDGTVHQMSLVFDAVPPSGFPDGFGRNGMMVSKSKDGGLTWSDPILLIDDTLPTILNDKNSLTADPTDSNFVYAVWDRLKISGADAIFPENVSPGRGLGLGIGLGFSGPIFFARSTDGGETWEPARKIFETGANDQTIGNQIVVLPEGTVVDFFTELKNIENSDQQGPGFNFNLALLRSTDKGVSWQPPGNNAIIAARIFSSFGALTPDEGIPVRDAAILFDVAVDPVSGSLYAAWQDIRFAGIEEVAFAQSTDGGFTWSTPIKVNQTPPTPANPLRAQAFLPSVAVTGDGTVVVTYYDFRNDDLTGELADYFAASCAANCANPASWGNEARLTDVSFDYRDAPFARGLFLGDYEGLAADGPDAVAAFGIADPADPATIFFRRLTP